MISGTAAASMPNRKIGLRNPNSFHALFMVDLRINETFQTGAVRKPYLPFCRLVGTVFNSADAVRLETAPTGSDKSGSKPRGERVYLFFRIHYKRLILKESAKHEVRCPFIPPLIPPQAGGQEQG